MKSLNPFFYIQYKNIFIWGGESFLDFQTPAK